MKKITKIIISIFVIIVLSGVFLCIFWSSKGMSYTKGRCLVVNDNTYVIVIQDSPIVMSNQTKNKELFKGLETGDEIAIVHGEVLTSYPGQTEVYALKKLGSGSLDDISDTVLQSLFELGWVIDADNVDGTQNSQKDSGEGKDENKGDNIEGEQDNAEKITFIQPSGNTVATRICTPKGYQRITCSAGSFAEYARNFPVKPDGSPVLLYDGTNKRNQSAHIAVLELPIENRDLQQCADSVMRIYAEYYYQLGQYDKIKFHFVSGFLAEYTKWVEGYRVSIEGSQVSWVKTHGYDASYDTFKEYMKIVFAYASTLSMNQEATPITLEELQIGDVFIKGGSPGHVVMVIDICENKQGEKAFLLAQGYMPAQEFHVIKNPLHEDDPWYYADEITYPFRTAEYTFQEGSLKRLNY